ncbi:MAG: hypothetical protein V1778_01810 [bacterium]
MKVNIRKILQFYDDPQEKGHASGITGLIGEELCAAAFCHYINSQKKKIRFINGTVSLGKQKGKRLDKWISIGEKNKTLYQCEIKNWAANAIGGKHLAVDSKQTDIMKVTKINWKRQSKVVFVKDKFPNELSKVILPMLPPKNIEYSNVEPLLIYWMPINNKGAMKPYFKVPVSVFRNLSNKTSFKFLNIFSVSLYFRNLLKTERRGCVDLELPITEKRMEILREIFSKKYV